jgi:hypothetical protein
MYIDTVTQRATTINKRTHNEKTYIHTYIFLFEAMGVVRHNQPEVHGHTHASHGAAGDCTVPDKHTNTLHLSTPN